MLDIDSFMKKRSPVTLLILAPLLGGSLVLFLPFVGIYLVAKALLMKGLGRISHYCMNTVQP